MAVGADGVKIVNATKAVSPKSNDQMNYTYTWILGRLKSSKLNLNPWFQVRVP